MKKEVHGDMSYAIVRNEKLTRAEINGKGTHNDRKATWIWRRTRGRIEPFLLNKYRVEISTLYQIFR